MYLGAGVGYPEDMTEELDPNAPDLVRFPPLQAQPGKKQSKWVNQRELGRLFGLKGAEMGKCLAQLGWRDDRGRPARHLLDQGVAKAIWRSRYEAGKVVEKVVTGYRWNTDLAVPLLKQYGLEVQSSQDVFVHALTDLVARSLRHTSTRKMDLAQALENWPWFTERVEENLKLVPEDQLPGFLGKLHDQLVDRKVPTQTVEVFLEAIGQLAALRAQQLESSLPCQASPARARPRM